MLAVSARLGRRRRADVVPDHDPGPAQRKNRLDSRLGAADVAPVDRWLVIYRDSRSSSCTSATWCSHRPPPSAQWAWETPTGLFYVQSRFVPRRYPILGAFAFETSGYSKLSDWPGGGVVGVHGTNAPWLIGQAVSHGCVRLRNSDVVALRKLVHVGTPIKIVAAWTAPRTPAVLARPATDAIDTGVRRRSTRERVAQADAASKAYGAIGSARASAVVPGPDGAAGSRSRGRGT